MRGKNESDARKFCIHRKIRREDFWKYLPLKKGLKHGDFEGGKAWQVYWEKILVSLGMNIKCGDSDVCDCIVVPSISEKTLALVVDDDSPDWRKLFSEESNVGLVHDYINISEQLRSWLCVGEPIRS